MIEIDDCLSTPQKPLFGKLEFTIKSFSSTPLWNNKQRYTNKGAIKLIRSGEKLRIKELILDLNIPAIINKIELHGIKYSKNVEVLINNNPAKQNYNRIFFNRPVLTRDKMKTILLGNLPCRMIKLIFEEETYFNPINIHIIGIQTDIFKQQVSEDVYELCVNGATKFLKSCAKL